MKPSTRTGALIVITAAGLSTAATPSLLASVCPGPLFPAPQFAIPGYDTFIVAADLDGDGHDDIAAASSAGASVLLFESNGVFADAVIYSSGNAEAIVAADLDQDGDIDLASAHQGNAPLYPSGVRILINAGNGVFTGQGSHAVGTLAVAIIAADLNADGVPDLATVNWQSGTVSVLVNSGNAIFTAAVDYPAGPAPTTLAAADFNQDGFPDLAVGSDAHNILTLLLNQDGIFTPLTSLQLAGPSFWITSGDFNEDRDPDLAVASFANNGNVIILLGDREATFEAATLVTVDPYPIHLVANDLDLDGHVDLAVTGLFCQEAGFEHCAAVLVGDGKGGFGAPDYLVAGPTNPDSSVVVAGRFNGDELPDVAVITGATRELTVLLADDPGHFSAAIVPEIGFHWSMYVAVADVDNDGDLDIASADDIYNEVSVFLQSDGVIGPPVDYSVTNDPRAIAFGHLNDDGHLDLALGNQGVFTLPVMYGQGDGTFPETQEFPYAMDGRSVAAGDLDGDGDDDLARVRWSADAVSVLLDEEDFGSPPFVDYPTGDGPNAVLIGDLDEDDDHDLVTVNGSGLSATVLFNNGSGAFSAPTNYPTGGSGYGGQHGALGDVDGDDDLDIAVPCCQSLNGHVTLLVNAGDGTFDESITIMHTGGPTAVAIGDLNGDGLADLATADHDGHGVSIFLGQGGLTFQYASSHAVASAAIHLAIADLNADGFEDLVVGGAGGVSVLYNAGCMAADLDGDNDVDGADLGALLLAWGDCPEGIACAADLTADGVVDGADLGALLLDWTDSNP